MQIIEETMNSKGDQYKLYNLNNREKRLLKKAIPGFCGTISKDLIFLPMGPTRKEEG